jgi:hypothetical protein
VYIYRYILEGSEPYLGDKLKIPSAKKIADTNALSSLPTYFILIQGMRAAGNAL